MKSWGDSSEIIVLGRRTWARSPLLIILAILVLLVCIGFNIFYAFFNTHPGFIFDVYWSVSDVATCHEAVNECGSSPDSVQTGDKLISVGTTTFAEWFPERDTNPFTGIAVGELVPLTVERSGRIIEIDWTIPQVETHTRIESAILPLFIYLPFWIVGTVVLLFIRPHGTSWQLLIALCYLTALWLAIGMSSAAPPPTAATLVHALSWIMVAVYLHFHLTVPEPLITQVPPFIKPAFYTAMVVMMVLELFRIPPVDLYIIALFIALLTSCLIVVYQVFRTSTAPKQITSRLMMAGIIIAVVPGFLLWLVPRILNFQAESLISIIVPVIAITALPLFYMYAIYKKSLGVWEFRLNRLIYYFTLFLLAFSVLSLVFLIGNRWRPQSYDVTALFIIVAVAVLLSALPLQRRFQRFLDHLAYGSGQSPEEIYRKYSTRIPASITREDLKSLLYDEILPNLGVQQSALYLHSGDQLNPLYELHLGSGMAPDNLDDLELFLDHSLKYIPDGVSSAKNDGRFGWVRLFVPIKSRIGVVGSWIFGERYPDSYYPQEDIRLFKSLADQLATTIENQHLIEEIQKELLERQIAETQKQQYADRIRLIHQIDQAILAAESSYEIAQAVLLRIANIIPCSHASIFTFNITNEEAELLASFTKAVDEPFEGARFPLAQISNLYDRVVGGESLSIGEIASMFETEVDLIFGNQLVNSILIVPLMYSNRAVGLLNIGSLEPDTFDQEHRAVALEVANSLAIAIQNAQLMSEVERHGIELKELSRRLLTAQETERKHISQELHDEIGQLLTAIFFNISAVERGLPQNTDHEIRERLADTDGLIDELMNHVRSMSLELRPAMLQDLGLIPTLRWYLKQSAQRLDIDIDFQHMDIEFRLSEDIETACYRILQEALTNAVRHGHADRITVTVFIVSGVLKITFEDNGIGFDTDQTATNTNGLKGVGLLGIRERASNVGGEITIQSNPGEGTYVELRIPIIESDE